MKIKLISLSIAALFGSGMAHAVYTPTVTTTCNNFTMVSASDGLTGGTNDVTFTWDGTYRTAVVTDKTNNATLSSPTDFSGKIWTAHHMNVYAPGTYTFYTGCTITQTPTCGVGTAYTLTVGAGQVGAHMLFNWSTSTNIDVVLLWKPNDSWAGTGTVSAYNTPATILAPTCPASTTAVVWGGVSIDTNIDVDTFSGTQMVDGPFIGQSANFNVNGITAAVYPTLDVATPVSPASGSTVSASTTTNYVVKFSKAMDATTITSGFLTFSPAVTVGTPVDDGTHTQFTFPIPLVSGTAYSISFNNAGVKDLANLPLTAPAGTTLTTSPVTVTGTSPANGNLAVSPGASTLAVTFSEPMNTPATNYLVLNPGAQTPASVTDSGDHRTFNFGVTLAGLTAYTVTFDSGSTPTDLTGGAVAHRANVGFTTIAAPDITSPTVSAGTRAPVPSSVGQVLQPTIAVTFSEPMDPAITAAAIHVTKVSGGATVPCAFTPNGSNSTFTCIVSSNLDFSSAYQVTVGDDPARTPANANAAQDAAHNNLIANANNTWTFTTRAAVATLTNAGVTAVTNAGDVTAVSSSATPTGTPLAGVTYDADYVTYTVSNVPPANTFINVTLTFQNSLVGKDLYKINLAGVYSKIVESGTLGANDCVWQRVAGGGIHDREAVVTIKDNLSCDLSSTTGVIVDPIVPGAPIVVAASAATAIGVSGGGGGCTVDPTGRDASLLVILLASLGFTGWRRRRN